MMVEWADSGLKPGPRFVAYVLRAECVNGLDVAQQFRVSASALADVTGISKATVRKYLNDLAAAGWIEHVDGRSYRWLGMPARADFPTTDEVEKPARAAVAPRDITTVFEAWRDTMPEPGCSRLKLTKGRADRIRARMREGWTVADLCDAVRGWRFDDWPDRVKHNDLDVLLRNSAQVEKFVGLYRGDSPGSATPTVSQGVRSVAKVVGGMKQARRPTSYDEAVDAAVDELNGRNLPIRRGVEA